MIAGDLLDLDAVHRAMDGCRRLYFSMSVNEKYLEATTHVAVGCPAPWRRSIRQHVADDGLGDEHLRDRAQPAAQAAPAGRACLAVEQLAGGHDASDSLHGRVLLAICRSDGHRSGRAEVAPVIEKSGLLVTDIEILRLHYADTLAAWRRRFLSHRRDAAAILGERFCRLWEFYLASAETGFRYGGLAVFQIHFVKELVTVPRTRTYITEQEEHLPRLERTAAAPPLAAE